MMMRGLYSGQNARGWGVRVSVFGEEARGV